MNPVSKSAALNCLEDDWSKFVIHFESLAPEARESYLQRQGFTDFPSLLAHIGAWWGEAIANIQAVVQNPEIKLQTYDVDRFNAEAIRAADGKNGQAVIRDFEETRQRLVEVVSTLSEAQITHGEIQKQLYWMITNHCAEHKLRMADAASPTQSGRIDPAAFIPPDSAPVRPSSRKIPRGMKRSAFILSTWNRIGPETADGL